MTESNYIDSMSSLELDSVIGYNGNVPNGLKVLPDESHLVYPLGNTVCIEHITTKQLRRLRGHTNSVSCIAVSNTGRYLASGQITHMGFKADIIVWDMLECKQIQKLTLHKVKVQDLAFSPNDKYLVSLGGQDDGSVVVWDLNSLEAICGNPAQVDSAGITYCVAYSKQDDYVFVTGGDKTLRVWTLDTPNRKIKPIDVNMGNFKRIIKCILVADKDVSEPLILCGTTTGDIIGINYNTKLFQIHGPVKDLFGLGVTALALLKNNDILVGAGDGEVAIVKFYKKASNGKKGSTKDIKDICLEKKKSWRDKNLKSLSASEITSLAIRGQQGHQFFIGSANCQIYRVNRAEFMSDSGDQPKIDKKTGLKIEKKSQTDDCGIELVKTCHSKAVNDIVFPFGCPQLVISCQFEEIRVWDMLQKKEKIRHIVANKTCNALCITRDGKTIHSAWDDGVIRGYGLAGDLSSLKDKYIRETAHSKGVTAIACTSNGQTLVTGGGEGQVRIWNFSQCQDAKGKTVYILKLAETMMEHKGEVSDVQITRRDTECATASNDGTCIVWDLISRKRKAIFFANTLFKCCSYDMAECQIVTSGTDRKIGFFDIQGGDRIRELDGSLSGAVNSICLSPDGRYIVTGGEDRLIKVWTYQEGECVGTGEGHSDSVKKVKIGPDQRWIVSVSEDGAILIWRFPFPPDHSQMRV